MKLLRRLKVRTKHLQGGDWNGVSYKLCVANQT